MTFAGEWWADIDITFYGKAEDYAKIGNESAILMPNHRSDIDWLVGYIIAERKGILGVGIDSFRDLQSFVILNCS